MGKYPIYLIYISQDILSVICVLLLTTAIMLVMLMASLPSADEVAKKYSARAAVAQPDYVAGIKKVDDWQARTKAGEMNYNAGVQAAISEGRFGKGVDNVSNADWQKAATAKAGRYPEGVNASLEKFKAAMAKVLSWEASGLAGLPARGPRRSSANKARMAAWFDHMAAYQK
jgi:hypothetical protein